MTGPLPLPIVRAAVAALPLLMVIGACEDAQTAAQRALSAKVDEAVKASAKALPGDQAPDEPEKAVAAAATLRSLAQGLSSMQGGTPAQRSAALLLASTLDRRAGEIELSVAADLEAAHRLERLAVSRAAASAASLDSLAAPLDRIDFASARTQLKSQRELAESQLRQLQTQVKTLESAIAQVDRQLSQTEAEAQRLDSEAEQLRAQAQSLRPRQALPYIEQAADLRIRNAELRGELGRRQSERSALAPQLAGAKALGQGGTAMLEVTDSALQDLQGLSEKAREAAARARRGASEIRAGAKTRLEAVLATMAGDLQARYDAAISGLERGASLAQQSGSGSDALAADSATIARASALLSLAQAQALRAMALSDHAALLAQLDAAGGWGESSQLQPAAKQASDAAVEAIAKAKEQYTAVIEMLETPMRSPALVNNGDVGALKDRAAQALQDLERPRGSASGSSSAAAGAPGPGGQGAATPQALVEILSAGGAGGGEAMRRSATIFRSQSSPELVASMGAMAEAMAPIADALRKKFGDAGQLGGAGGMGMQLPAGGVTLKSATDSTAVLEMAGPKGPVEVPAMKVDGAWFVDFDAMMEALAPGQGAMMASMAPMMKAMTQALAKAAPEFAKRIEAGEFKTAEEAQAAMAQMMQQAMMGSMGGGGGMKPG